MKDAVIHTEGLTKKYGKTVAVADVALDVPSGCVFALMGRNGAGKTSLIKMLLGLITIDSGSAEVLGMSSRKDHVQIRQKVGYVPENHNLYKWMTIGEIVRFTSAFYPTWDGDLCGEFLGKFGLDPRKKISELSRGMVAKTGLTLALAHRPALLILDEPTGGLDAVIRKEFLESIVDVAADEGRTVLISSHLLNDVERVADRVALMKEGRIEIVEELEILRDKVRKFRVSFDGDAPEALDLPGLLSVKKSQREWVVVLSDCNEGTERVLSEKLPGSSIDRLSMNLEDMFVALNEKRSFS